MTVLAKTVLDWGGLKPSITTVPLEPEPKGEKGRHLKEDIMDESL